MRMQGIEERRANQMTNSHLLVGKPFIAVIVTKGKSLLERRSTKSEG